MKSLKIYNLRKITIAIFALGAMASCSNDFTDRPSEDSISASNYYKNDEQVRVATDGLYYKTWFQFNNKFFYAISEVGSGNMYTNSSDVNAMRSFSITSSDAEMFSGWQSLWANVAQANYLINNLQRVADPSVSQSVINNALGEAYFMRATAYFYLVRLWGPVPIIVNNLDHVTNPQLNTNRVEDVYELVTRDYTQAISLLNSKVRGSSYADNAKVSKGSAKAMLAKVYLYLKDYTKARQLSEEVINSGEFKLLGGTSQYSIQSKSFGDLFKYANNNNEESVFALQWKTDANYGSGNNCNTQFGISNGTISTSNATYGGVFGPSQDILNLYSIGDARRNETIMFPGNVYSDMKIKNGTTFQVGFTVPAADQIGGQGAGAAIKKYCIGIASDDTGRVDGWGMMANSTYIMRYAELLLIHAEAVLAGGGSTSDAVALKSLNAVRNRAGLASVTSFTFDDLFKERRRELAFEGDFWFDLRRLPSAQALALLSSQNRGDLWSGVKNYSADVNDLLLPYPDNEVAKNPKLLEAPVDYQFK